MKITIEIDEHQFSLIVTDMNEAVEGVKDVCDDIKDVVDSSFVRKLEKLCDEYPYLQKVLEDIDTEIQKGE